MDDETYIARDPADVPGKKLLLQRIKELFQSLDSIPVHQFALLASEELRKLGAKIDYNKQNLEIHDIKIPFFFEVNPLNFRPFRQKTRNYIKITVNIDEGQVIIPQTQLNHLEIPESLVHAKDGFCIIPFEEVDLDEDISLRDADEIINDYHQNDIDNSNDNTQHTAVENPVFTMPISDKPVNLFSHRLILKLGDDSKVVTKRPFNKHNYEITVRRGSELKNLNEQIIDPKTLYGIYFVDKELESQFLTISTHF
ncbi:hypothetical protein ILUMI_01687 [Ignelater luminosus]|uniref:Uncharacterized protein n=1 Tax=Ignelater luminosus TaxID=2038154 RepID=A0A8K0GLH2_IGNLU|nr:hypothetical protein ILUMI_01687 [Ignelater luminosus]